MLNKNLLLMTNTNADIDLNNVLLGLYLKHENMPQVSAVAPTGNAQQDDINFTAVSDGLEKNEMGVYEFSAFDGISSPNETNWPIVENGTDRWRQFVMACYKVLGYDFNNASRISFYMRLDCTRPVEFGLGSNISINTEYFGSYTYVYITNPLYLINQIAAPANTSCQTNAIWVKRYEMQGANPDIVLPPPDPDPDRFPDFD